MFSQELNVKETMTMCGLVWKAGVDCHQQVPQALKRLEYRGYDSFGFASLMDVGIELYHSLDDLREFDEALPESDMVLGHTRWATHGGVNLENCHPHLDSKRRFALAHNGIVENFTELDSDRFSSDSALLTDLISRELDDSASPQQAFASVIKRLTGRNSLVVMFDDGEVLGYRSGSPLVLAQLSNGIGVASDPHAFGSDVSACCPLLDNMCFSYKFGQLAVYDSGEELGSLGHDPSWVSFNMDSEEPNSLPVSGSPGCDMKREILDQWRTLSMSIPSDEQCSQLRGLLNDKALILVTGAGGAALVAEQIAFLLQTRSGRRALFLSAGEIQRYSAFADDAVLLAISQSGETADTLMALEMAKSWGMAVVSLVNGPFTSMGRASDLSLDLRVGPERCVLSTKSATAQIAFGYWLSTLLSFDDEQKLPLTCKSELQQLGSVLCGKLDDAVFAEFDAVADYLMDHHSLFLLGRGEDFATATLGALNLKEASYIHAEAFSAGELKHGVIALVEQGTPVIVFGVDRDPYMSGVVAELKCRGATVISVGSAAGDLTLPEFGDGHPVTAPITCQILAYVFALKRGLDPDRPRNLAKSVTVL